MEIKVQPPLAPPTWHRQGCNLPREEETPLYQSETCENLQQRPRPFHFLSLRNEVSQEVRSHRFGGPEGPKQLLSPLSSIALISKGSEKVELFLDVGHVVMGMAATRCQETIATGFSHTLKSCRSFI